MTPLHPRLDGFDPALARRIKITVSCTDADSIAKVDHAGETREQDGTQVQIMHNGLVVEHGGYYGDWMAEVIRSLRGHHEPQEELSARTSGYGGGGRRARGCSVTLCR